MSSLPLRIDLYSTAHTTGKAIIEVTVYAANVLIFVGISLSCCGCLLLEAYSRPCFKSTSHPADHTSLISFNHLACL